MKQGKRICETLKSVRQGIADANSIEYRPAECTHTGECAGTCPQCESEVRYLERQLAVRRSMGKAVVVAGLALGLAAAPGQAMAKKPKAQKDDPKCKKSNVKQDPREVQLEGYVPLYRGDVIADLTKDSQDGVVVSGTVISARGTMLGGVAIMAKGSKQGTVTDSQGRFKVKVAVGDTLMFTSLGYDEDEFEVTEAASDIKVVLVEDNGRLMGDVAPIKK